MPAANCVKLPDHVRTEDATLIEPLSCAVRGYDVLTSQLGAHVLIYGAGTMGLMMLRAGEARRRGQRGRRRPQRRPARPSPATSASPTPPRRPSELEPPFGWDLVVDATGNAKAIQDGLGRVGKGGTFLQFGVADYAARATIDPYRIYNQEITITGSMAVLHSYERAAELFADGRARPGGLHHRPRCRSTTTPGRSRRSSPAPGSRRRSYPRLHESGRRRGLVHAVLQGPCRRRRHR